MRKNSTLGRAALIVSVVALIAALGGGAWAVSVKLKSGQVKTKNLKNGAVKSSKLADGPVTSPKLGNVVDRTGTLSLAADAGVNSGAVVGSALTVPCAAGEKVIGGGGAYVVTDVNADVSLRSSFQDGNGWRVAAINDSAAAQTYVVHAYCLAP